MRWFVLFCCMFACGRNDTPTPDGTEGGRCYGNGTCDAELVCTSNLCVSPNLCAEVDCSGHGTCKLTDLRPTCTCDDDFHAVGLTCVPGCPPDGCTHCPNDMALSAAQGTCIDRFEGTVFLNPDCTGPRFGAGWDDFPPTFPDLVASPGCEDPCAGQAVVEPTVELYACSVADIEPTSFVTYFQARRACHAVGKRLCTGLEWQSACQGPNANQFPYGNSYDAAACNGGDQGQQLANTGQYPTCAGGYPGMFDMSGNLMEWTETVGRGPGYRDMAGGDFLTYGSDHLDCMINDDEAATTARSWLGFRCCK